ncbi:MAG: hypothetical protein LBD05_01050 [Mycoplasmataceae bacterium]|nr:hypothetical protein [Mycoplasmataceae bacterium]
MRLAKWINSGKFYYSFFSSPVFAKKFIQNFNERFPNFKILSTEEINSEFNNPTSAFKFSLNTEDITFQLLNGYKNRSLTFKKIFEYLEYIHKKESFGYNKKYFHFNRTVGNCWFLVGCATERNNFEISKKTSIFQNDILNERYFFSSKNNSDIYPTKIILLYALQKNTIEGIINENSWDDEYGRRNDRWEHEEKKDCIEIYLPIFLTRKYKIKKYKNNTVKKNISNSFFFDFEAQNNYLKNKYKLDFISKNEIISQKIPVKSNITIIPDDDKALIDEYYLKLIELFKNKRHFLIQKHEEIRNAIKKREEWKIKNKKNISK